MRIEDIEAEVLAWHKETFPNATGFALVEKFNEECGELVQSILSPNKGVMIDELADVCICAIALLRRSFGASLADVIATKLAINKGRAWGPESANGNRSRVK